MSRRVLYFILIAISILLVSCHNNKAVLALLEDVDSYIENSPDSALTTLQSIDQSQLHSANRREQSGDGGGYA